MKALKFSMYALFLTGVFLTSCKKETKVAKPDESTNKLYARTLKIYDADHINSATLRFQSSSNDLLAAMPLEDVDFTLVVTPEPSANNAADLTASSSFGTVSLSERNTNQTPSSVDELQKSDKVIFVDLVSAPTSKSLSIEVKSKAPANDSRTSRTSSVNTFYPPGVKMFFYGAAHWRKVHIDNLSSSKINVSFYYNSCEGNICQTNGDLKGTFTKYSGYSYNLYLNGWAWYSNCSKGVGALVAADPGYWFRWTAWSNC